MSAVLEPWTISGQSLLTEPVVDLECAWLCLDCKGISRAPEERCARCRSKALLDLASVLNRVEGGNR